MEGRTARRRLPVSSWCERTAATSAAAVVAVSDGMRADIMTAYPEISAERVRVIRNGIDTGEYAPDRGHRGA